MKCPNCSAEVPGSAVFCPSCGKSMPSTGSGRAADEVTREWVREVIVPAGYDVTFSEEKAHLLRAKHASRPNIQVGIRKDLGVITIQHWWGMQKPGWSGDKEMRVALNEANAASWFDTFSVDAQGDLGVSSYITLAHRLSEHNILQFLERESESFMKIIAVSGLRKFMK